MKKQKEFIINYTSLRRDVDVFLEENKEHHRLRVFYFKGKTCVTCGIEGNVGVFRLDGAGGIHKDLFHWTEDHKVLMTVDHIYPISKGGQRHLNNEQPMCTKCNCKKADKIPTPKPQNNDALSETRLLETPV